MTEWWAGRAVGTVKKVTFQSERERENRGGNCKVFILVLFKTKSFNAEPDLNTGGSCSRGGWLDSYSNGTAGKPQWNMELGLSFLLLLLRKVSVSLGPQVSHI